MQKIRVGRVERKPVGKGGIMTTLFDEKGTRLSGFLASLQEVNEGDIINAEIQVETKDGKQYTNIASFEFVERAPRGPAPAAPPAAPSVLTFEQQFRLAREERRSREAIAAWDGIVRLASSQSYPSGDIDSLLEKGFRWAGERLGAGDIAEAPEPPPPKDPGGAEAPDALKDMATANPGEFYTAAYKYLDLVKSKVDKEIGGCDLSDPAQRRQAWQTLYGIYGHKKEG